MSIIRTLIEKLFKRKQHTRPRIEQKPQFTAEQRQAFSALHMAIEDIQADRYAGPKVSAQIESLYCEGRRYIDKMPADPEQIRNLNQVINSIYDLKQSYQPRRWPLC